MQCPRADWRGAPAKMAQRAIVERCRLDFMGASDVLSPPSHGAGWLGRDAPFDALLFARLLAEALRTRDDGGHSAPQSLPCGAVQSARCSLERCLGTNPIHAKKSRPDRNALDQRCTRGGAKR